MVASSILGTLALIIMLVRYDCRRIAATAADRHAVLVFRGQAITDARQVAFRQVFGWLETTIKGQA